MPRPTLLTGLPVHLAQKMLQEAQQAYHDLSTGQKGEVFAYTQGDGSRSVKYTVADLGQITARILELQTYLGLRTRARRPIRPLY